MSRLQLLLVLVALVGAAAAAGRVPRALTDLLPFGNNTNSCLCVPFYNCEDGVLITDGAGLLNPRYCRRTAQP